MANCLKVAFEQNIGELLLVVFFAFFANPLFPFRFEAIQLFRSKLPIFMMSFTRAILVGSSDQVGLDSNSKPIGQLPRFAGGLQLI